MNNVLEIFSDINRFLPPHEPMYYAYQDPYYIHYLNEWMVELNY